MRRLLQIALIACVMATAVACGSGAATDAALGRADSLMESLPDSSYAILDSLRAADSASGGSTLNTDLRRARFAMLYSQACYRTYRPSPGDSLAAIATGYFLTDPDSPDYMRSLFYRGIASTEREDPIEAYINFRQCFDIANRLNLPLWIARSAEQLADICMNSNQNDRGIELLHTALSNYQLVKLHDHELYICYFLANSYLNDHDSIKALNTIRLLDSIDVNPSAVNQQLRYSINATKFVIYTNTDHLAQAEQYVGYLLSDSIRPFLDSHDYANIALYYTKRQEYPKAVAHLQSSESMMAENIDSLMYYTALNEYAEAIHDYRLSAQSSDSLFALQGRTVDVSLSQSPQKAEIALTRLYAQQTRHKIETRLSRAITVAIILAAACIIIIICYRKLTLKRKKKAAILALNVSALTKQLNRQAAQLRDTINELEGQQRHFTELRLAAAEIFQNQFADLNLAYTLSQHTDDEVEEIQNRLKELRHASSLSKLKSIINSCMDNVADKLDTCGLSDKMVSFAIMLIAGMSRDVINAIFGVNPKTFYSRRKRLINKIRESKSPYADEILRLLARDDK